MVDVWVVVNDIASTDQGSKDFVYLPMSPCSRGSVGKSQYSSEIGTRGIPLYADGKHLLWPMDLKTPMLLVVLMVAEVDERLEVIDTRSSGNAVRMSVCSRLRSIG